MTFTIDDENEITAFASQEEATAATTTPFDTFTTQLELAVSPYVGELVFVFSKGLIRCLVRSAAGRKS